MRPNSSIMEQLADFHSWAQGGPDASMVSLLDYVGFVATPDLFFGFAELFWPDMVVHDGLRFLASGFSPEVYRQWRAAGKDDQETQRVMNHVHVCTLFQQQPVSDEVAVAVAHAIAAIWSRTLGPEGLVAEAIGRDLDDAATTFFEKPAHANR